MAPIWSCLALLALISSEILEAVASPNAANNAVASTSRKSKYHRSRHGHKSTTLRTSATPAQRQASTTSSTIGPRTTTSITVTATKPLPRAAVAHTAASYSPVALKCPASNGKIYQGANGRNFVIEYGMNYKARHLSTIYASNFQDCIEHCAADPDCMTVSLVGEVCYTKGHPGAPIPVRGWTAKEYHGPPVPVSTAATSATLASSPSPRSPATSTSKHVKPTTSLMSFSSSTTLFTTSTSTSMTSQTTSTAQATSCANLANAGSTTYTDNAGVTYILECGTKYNGISVPPVTTADFESCLAACSAKASCVGIHYSTSTDTCVLFTSITSEATSAGYDAAKVSTRIAASSTSS